MEEQEISLRELIEILLKNKKMIITITLASILLTALVSVFILKPSYEAEAKLIVADIAANPSNGNISVMLSDPKGDVIGEEEIKEMIESVSNQSRLTLQGYMEQIKNPEIINNVIEELELEKKGYTLSGLRGAITVENIEETNILSLKVKDADPKQAAEIANSIATHFSSFISELSTKQATQSLDYVENKLAEEKKNLQEVLVTYKEALAQAGVSEGNIEAASIDQQVDLELIDLQVDNARNKYKALLAKSEKIKLADSFNIGEATIVVSSKAYETQSPVAPNKTLNVAIALVLGLMIGIFAAFAKEYWQSTGTDK